MCKAFAFIDLFSGAGGFSEGFLQVETQDKRFEFILASDINNNCLLTHFLRYRVQLGLDTNFLLMDIKDPEFIPRLKKLIGGKQIDVITGGPPCQSFSLAGKRSQYDAKDDLFSYYIEVIRSLKPKYFVMENVLGILSKDEGRVKDRIIEQMNSVFDTKKLSSLIEVLSKVYNSVRNKNKSSLLLNFIIKRLECESKNFGNSHRAEEEYFMFIYNYFNKLIPKLATYHMSKTDRNISTIRHGLRLLQQIGTLGEIKTKILDTKARANLNNDEFEAEFDNFISNLEKEGIIKTINGCIKKLALNELEKISLGLNVGKWTLSSCMEELIMISRSFGYEREVNECIQKIKLYNIVGPFVLNSSDYGVPQDRQRAIFIGCRIDQELIDKIPPTVMNDEKATIFEALHDLDIIRNNEEVTTYENRDSKIANGAAKFYGKFKHLIKLRGIDGRFKKKGGKTYAQWSRKGRLSHRFVVRENLITEKSYDQINNKEEILAECNKFILCNHKTSSHNKQIQARLAKIIEAGSYEDAREVLVESGLDSKKRNYNLLKTNTVAPTIVTMPDDYVHYRAPRALTVREMARLQSFDDSLVFQGKRTTGGDRRKAEIPQYTLVGNAIPPLMARAIGKEILRKIK